MTALLVVDTTQPEAFFVDETTLAPMNHFGIPMRVHDLSLGPLSREDINSCAVVVISQEHLGLSLKPEDVRLLLEGVENGVGLANFDSDVASYGTAYLETAGFAGPNGLSRTSLASASQVAVTRNDHPVSWLQDGPPGKRFRLPVPTTRVQMGEAAESVLIEDEAEAPLLTTFRLGKGRGVQWLASPRVWLHQFFGHGAGLDDMWLRSILWAARKPFLISGMPPLARIRLDDCQGLWRTAADLEFLDALTSRGHIPTLCYCLRALEPSGASKMSSLHDHDLAEFAPHTLAPGVSMFYGVDGHEYTDGDFRSIFRELDDFTDRIGVKPSRILSDHDHAWSERAIPSLLRRGISYKMNITLPGEPFEGEHVDWHPAPYANMDYAFSFLPGRAKDFFVVHNHYPLAFEPARTYMSPDRYVYHRAGGYGEYKWDFLNGLTRGESQRTNQLETMAQRLADHTRLGLNSMFFGGSITHSHFAGKLSRDEWDIVLGRADELMPHHRYELAGYETIADNARCRAQTAVIRADFSDGEGAITVAGESDISLRMQVFVDDDLQDVRYEVLPPFTEVSRLVFSV
jgi:hypothetical protein